MEKYRKLNANTIKLIAVTAMTIDHTAWMIFPGYPREMAPVLLHMIGRVTCPIMCYFVAEGFYHTKNVRRYTIRLFAFALLSHFAYVFASMDFVDWKSFIPCYYGSVLNQTSVMWPLAWGLVMLRIANSQKIRKDVVKTALIILICLISFPGDWSCVAGLWIMAFGTNREKFKEQMFWMVFYVAIYAAVYFFAIDRLYGLLQMAVVFAIPILMMYNGERGKNQTWNRVMKWLFYAYYPLHLFVIGWIQYVR